MCYTFVCPCFIGKCCTVYISASASSIDSVVETNEVENCRIEDAYVDLVAGVGLTVAAAAIGVDAPVLGAMVGFLGGHAVNFSQGLISRAMQLADSDDDGIYESGVVLTKYYVDGFVVYAVDAWPYGTMHGVRGQVGTWTNNDFEE